MRHTVGVLILVIVAALLVSIAGATLAWRAWGPQWLTGYAVVYAQRLGREVAIARLDIRWSLTPTIIATDVAIGNPAWASRPYMLTVSRAQGVLDLRALLSRVVKIDDIRLERIDLLLETGKAGQRNWRFRFRNTFREHVEDVPAIDLRAAHIGHARIGILDGRTISHVTIEKLAARASDAFGPVSIQFAGIVGDEPVSGDATLGSLKLLRDPDDPYPIDVALHTRIADGRVTGRLRKPLHDLRLDLEASVAGDEVAEFLKAVGANIETIGGFGASAHVVGPLAAPMLQHASAWVRGSGVDVALRGTVADLRGLDRIDISASARISDRALLGLLFASIPAPHVLTVKGRFIRAGSSYRAQQIGLRIGKIVLRGDARLKAGSPRPHIEATLRGALDFAGWSPRGIRTKTTSARLPVHLLRALDADIGIDLKEVVIPGMPALQQVHAQLSLQNGQGLIAPLALRIGATQNEFTARLMFAPGSSGSLAASMQLVAPSVSLPELLDVLWETSGIEGGLTVVDVDLESTGATPRELVARLNGEATMVIGETHLAGRKLDFGADVLTELLTFAMPFVRTEKTVVQCAAVRLPIVDGIITIDRSVALETGKVTIVGSGVVNLKDNSIELFTRTRARTGLGVGGGLFTDIVQVTGSLDQPHVGISDEVALRSGLSVGAAVATGGFTWLARGLLGRFTDDKNACSTAMTEN